MVLMTIFHPLQYNLSAFNVTNGQGRIMEDIFQEVDTTTSEVVFEWRSLDYVDPTASYCLPKYDRSIWRQIEERYGMGLLVSIVTEMPSPSLA